MIKFGIPSINATQDIYPDKAVIMLNALENANSKRRITFSRLAAEKLGVQPGISEVALSFDRGNFVAVIPNTLEGVPKNDRYLVNKELTFTNKKAYDYMVETFELSNSQDNYLEITEFNTDTDNGLIIGSFTSETIPVFTSGPQVDSNNELI